MDNHHSHNICCSKAKGWMFFPVRMFSHSAEGWASNRWYHRWGQESGAPFCVFLDAGVTQSVTLYNPPHHLNSQSTHSFFFSFCTYGFNWTQENLLSYFASKSPPLWVCVFLHFILLFSHLWLSVSPSTSQQTVSADTAAALRRSRLVVYDQKPISAGSNEKKKKESGQFSGER